MSWILRPAGPSERAVRQSAWRILVSSSLARIESNDGDLWDSGRVLSSRTLDIPYAGRLIPPRRQAFWKVEVWDGHGATDGWSAPAQFTMAPARLAAQWIAAAPAGSIAGRREGVTYPMPVFRTEFAIRRPLARALLYVSGMGQDEVHINGVKAGDRELAPGWTDYRRRVLYDAYDVTPLLRSGNNVIGVLLGNGMFNVAHTPGRYTKFVGSLGQPKLLLELCLRFRDGTTRIVSTGPAWRTTPGPVTFSSTYGGEDYDARAVPAAWDQPGPLVTGVWKKVFVVPGPGGRLQPETTAPIVVARVYRPIAQRRLSSGDTVCDLGQNIAGWPAIVVRGRAGATVKLIGGELLAPDGSVSQRSENAGPGHAQWFSYTLSGKGVERWHPRFSLYGFRYVQVEISGRARLLSLTGDAVHSSAPATGSFLSSVPLLNRIHLLILRAIQNNMESVLTDCPGREKLGWLEQTHLMGSALNFDFDLQLLYSKIESDMADAQRSDGMVPTIAPQYTTFGNAWNVFNNAPEWGSAAVLDPWLVYRRYGDIDELRRHYPMMRAYVRYLTGRSRNGIVDYGLGDWYDVGPAPPGFSQLTSTALTATAVYYQDLVALQSAAGVLGDTAEARRLQLLRTHVARAFQRRFYHPASHNYDRDSQTANAMPLALGITPPPDRAAVLQNLVADIRAHHYHTTAGEIGFPSLVEALQENGASKVMLDMLLRRDPPSYGYQLRQGATSLTEAWNADPDDSQDHFMLGDAEEWFYAGLGGIHIDLSKDPAHAIVIRPSILSSVAWVKVGYRSPLGTIRVAWRHTRGKIILTVVIPPNTSARVLLPATARLSPGLQRRLSAEHVRFRREKGGRPELRIQSSICRIAFRTGGRYQPR